jgi:hypothetical protein
MSLYAYADTPSNICRVIEDIRALDRRDALQLADGIFDSFIGELQRIPGIPRRSHAEWRVLLGQIHPQITEQIDQLTCGRVDLDEVLNTIESMGW